MSESVKALAGDAIAALDGTQGRVDEVIFDDRDWRVRYLVVDPYAPLSGRKVLVATHAVDRARTSESAVAVRLSRAEMARGPSADSAMPVSRLYEEASARYYSGAERDPREMERTAERTHLRSSGEVIGYSVHGPQGRLGHVEDLVLEDGAWKIAALSVDTGSERSSRIDCERIQTIDWKTREVRLRS